MLWNYCAATGLRAIYSFNQQTGWLRAIGAGTLYIFKYFCGGEAIINRRKKPSDYQNLVKRYNKLRNYVRGQLLSQKNILSMEVFGRGVLYGIQYERMINNRVTLGIGYSHYNVSVLPGLGKVDARVTIVPIATQFYLNPGRHRAFVNGGFSIVHIKGKYDMNDFNKLLGAANVKTDLKPEVGAELTQGIPTMGLGYEFRSQYGFVFRTSVYAFVIDKVTPWAGLSWGAIF